MQIDQLEHTMREASLKASEAVVAAEKALAERAARLELAVPADAG